MATITVTRLLSSAAFLLLTSAFLRLLYILPSIHPTRPSRRRRRHDPTRLLVVLGSGGHTAEMLAILKNLDTSAYTHRTYVISEGDDFSARKARDFEASLTLSTGTVVSTSKTTTAEEQKETSFDIQVVPRARKIHQPLSTTPISAVRCLISCFSILRRSSPTATTTAADVARGTSTTLHTYPDLVMTNGPGTAVCVVLACLMLRFLDVRGTKGKMRTIYVESWARVKSLSLSGKILIGVVDRFLVQWESLRGVGGRGEYLGVLV
ncbi:MAG: UDP-N-acetylglucosamine transferase subunit [Peltula sp. TS41687]|nr:MAG: UDP-N-acetylglucosamine transferase subunit [Peltula sp. TS41687]